MAGNTAGATIKGSYSSVLENRGKAMQKIARGLLKQNKNLKSIKDINMK